MVGERQSNDVSNTSPVENKTDITTSGVVSPDEQHIRINESLGLKRANILSSQNSTTNKSTINND